MVGLLVFPACCALSHFSTSPNRITAKRQTVYGLAVESIAIICGIAFVKTMQHSYGTKDSRIAQTYLVSSRLNVYDTEARAQLYQRAIKAVEQYSNDNPFLVLANHQTQLYYATGKIPFLGNTETHTYMGQALLDRLDNRVSYYGRYPVIAFIEGIGEQKTETQHILKAYMQHHQYQLSHSEDGIQIYIRQ